MQKKYFHSNTFPLMKHFRRIGNFNPKDLINQVKSSKRTIYQNSNSSFSSFTFPEALQDAAVSTIYKN